MTCLVFKFNSTYVCHSEIILTLKRSLINRNFHVMNGKFAVIVTFVISLTLIIAN